MTYDGKALEMSLVTFAKTHDDCPWDDDSPTQPCRPSSMRPGAHVVLKPIDFQEGDLGRGLRYGLLMGTVMWGIIATVICTW